MGERNDQVSSDDVHACLDFPTRDLLGPLPHKLSELWKISQWCRERDVMHYAGVDKETIKFLADSNLVQREEKPWFRHPKKSVYGSLAMPLYQALLVKKYALLRPFLKRTMGAVGRPDIDMLTLLPLGTLLGVIVDKQLCRLLCTCYAWTPKGGSLTNDKPC